MNMVASVTEQQARLIMEAGDAAGEAAAAVERAMSAAEAASQAAAHALTDAEGGMGTADEARRAMTAVEESAAAIMAAADALVAPLRRDHRLRRDDLLDRRADRTCWP